MHFSILERMKMNRIDIHGILPFCIACLLLGGGAARSQAPPPEQRERAYVGIFGAFNLNRHTADFRAIPGVPNCCPQFESGSGTGVTAGGLLQLPLSERFLLDLRAAYTGQNALLKRTETTLVDHEGETVIGTFDHTIDARIASVGIEPMLAYRAVGDLSVRVGARAALALTPTYEQKEVLTAPAVGTFAGTGSRVRNAFAGDLPNASSFSAALVAGISYDLPMDRRRTLFISPEAYYVLGLTPVVEGLTWSVHSVRLGLAVKYGLPGASAPVLAAAGDHASHDEGTVPPSGNEADAGGRTPPALAAQVSAVGLRADGVEEPKVTLRVEEFLSQRLRPLLNYVFFDENSGQLPARYARLDASSVSTFRVERLFNTETLPTYYHLLNIIGRRLTEHPEATIRIVGCNADQGAERGNRQLSDARAATVRDYLRDVWGIAERRMAIESRNLPGTPSNVAEADGVVENRRAEIYSDTWEIIAPVMTHDTLRTVNPPTVRFRPTAQAQAGVARWSLTASQRGERLTRFEGEGPVPATLEWELNREGGGAPRSGETVEYRLAVRDAAGQHAESPSGALPVELVTLQHKRRDRVADREIDRFSLILFDFDKAELNTTNKRIVGIIGGVIRPDSRVTITGYTDRMGDADYNARLSEARAQMAARSLSTTGASVSGLGEERPLFDNDLPEGRFYNRTVDVIVETPVH